MDERCRKRVSDLPAIWWVRHTKKFVIIFVLVYHGFYFLARSRDEVEDYLACLMDQEFDTIVDDGSLTEVGGV